MDKTKTNVDMEPTHTRFLVQSGWIMEGDVVAAVWVEPKTYGIIVTRYLVVTKEQYHESHPKYPSHRHLMKLIRIFGGVGLTPSHSVDERFYVEDLFKEAV